MRINVALFGKDIAYASRLLKGLQTNYVKQLSLKAFSEEQTFANELKAQFFDIAIIDQDCFSVLNCVPNRTVVALLVKDNSVDQVEKIPAIGKYQSIDNIYKQIIGIYAEHSARVKLRGHGANAQTILFTSAQGGVGTSSLAAAYAIHQANSGNKVFYLNLETFGTANCFFKGEGKGSFSDVIFALRSSKINTVMKLQSTIKRDESGVEFVEECKNAYDIMDLQDSNIPELLESITTVEDYDIVVIDYSAAFTARQLLLLKEYADSAVYVNDGSQIGNVKFQKFCEALRVFEQREKCSVLNKMGLLYNRYSSQTSTQLEKVPMVLLGGIHRIEGISGRDLVNKLSDQEMLNNIE